jgi:hypothetical protein
MKTRHVNPKQQLKTEEPRKVTKYIPPTEKRDRKCGTRNKYTQADPVLSLPLKPCQRKHKTSRISKEINIRFKKE